MDYDLLLEFAVELGYRLAMSGAETFRVEESITRIMGAYGIQGEVFAIPNCITASIETDNGKPITRLRRVGFHGNDLDSVERYSNLSRTVCQTRPTPETAMQWLHQADDSRRFYTQRVLLLSHFVSGVGFAMFFGGAWKDCLMSGVGGLIIGIADRFLNTKRTNSFFRIIISSFLMALFCYGAAHTPLLDNPDTAIIGALMLLVPGLLFTNAMRDIIFGDTNSGIIRIVQVFLIAAAIALGTGAARNTASLLWGSLPELLPVAYHSFWLNLGCAIGCFGFAVIFNVHGPGILICVVGGVLSWSIYMLTMKLGGNDLTAYFFAAFAASVFAELMARIRKYPAISYLVVAIFPLIPGASVYYTMVRAVEGDMAGFSQIGTHAAAIAGVLAVAILLVSTAFRIWSGRSKPKLTGGNKQ